MRVLFDHQCRQCGFVFEEFADSEDQYGPDCPECKATDAKRLIGAPRLDPKLGLDPTGFPPLGDKWARIRRQRQQIERKRNA